MGDLSREKNSCFPFRRKPFMLQYQAWWWDMKDPNINAACKDWVDGFRDAMYPKFTEGSFINFPDFELVPPKDPDHRRKLMSRYYDKNLQDLAGVKYQYDKNNVLDFPMGILPAWRL